MRVGEILEATVRAVMQYGVELEAEGLPGFVQPIDLAWDASMTPFQVATVGERIPVLMLAITPREVLGFDQGGAA